MCVECRANGAIALSRLITAGLTTLPAEALAAGLHDADLAEPVVWAALAKLFSLAYPEAGDDGERMNQDHVDEVATWITTTYGAVDVATLFRNLQNLAIMCADISQAMAQMLGALHEAGDPVAKPALLALASMPRLAVCTTRKVEASVMDWAGFEQIEDAPKPIEAAELTVSAGQPIKPTFPVPRKRKGGMVS